MGQRGWHFIWFIPILACYIDQTGHPRQLSEDLWPVRICVACNVGGETNLSRGQWDKVEPGYPTSRGGEECIGWCVLSSHSVQYQEPIDNIKFFAFGDASIHGMFAAVYAVVTQASGVTQGLIAAKSCLAKKSLTIPRLELVSGHITVNLTTNVRVALEGFSMTKDIQCWLDSTVALHWLNDDGEYRQFVANRVKKIQSHPNTQWRHVPTSENPAD